MSGQYTVNQAGHELSRVRALLELLAFASLHGANINDLKDRAVESVKTHTEDELIGEVQNRLQAIAI